MDQLKTTSFLFATNLAMEVIEQNLSFDIVIVGAGPAGCAAALTLKNSGLKVALLDKDTFPRDKICGDAVNGFVPQLMKRLLPEDSQAFAKLEAKQAITGFRLMSPDMHVLEADFHIHGICATRKDFDNHLFELVKQYSPVKIIENCKLKQLEYQEDGLILETSQGCFQTKAVIACDGAHSVVNKQLANFKMDPNHYCAAVRAYYRNIADCKPNKLEILFPKNHLPGYFWIFPYGENEYNVGYGMLSSTISKNAINIKKAFRDIIQHNDQVAERFKHAELLDDVKGFGLPLGSNKVPVSGERFLLTGDAASLINPLTGEGIGSAMLSAELAAKHLIEAFDRNDFSASFMKGYDVKIRQKFWKTMRVSYITQRLLNDRELLINLSIRLAGRSAFVKKWLNRMF